MAGWLADTGGSEIGSMHEGEDGCCDIIQGGKLTCRDGGGRGSSNGAAGQQLK